MDCDKCGCMVSEDGLDVTSYSEIRLPIEMGDFLATLENFDRRPPEGGAYVFRFCFDCVLFDDRDPIHEPDSRRAIDLVKESLGIFTRFGHA